jgi:hypothetical protein
MQKADDTLADPAEELRKHSLSRKYHLSIRGVSFLINEDDLERLQSGFLFALLDPETLFAQPEDRVFSVNADPECFSAFLHQARYGVLPRVDDSDLMVRGSNIELFLLLNHVVLHIVPH